MNITVNDQWIKDNGKYECPYCRKEYTKKGISTHIWMLHTEEGKLHSNKIKFKQNYTPWNKGLKTSSEVKQKISNSTKGKNNPFYGKHHSDITKKKISKTNSGKYKKVLGRGKSGWYKGYWCDSSYELAFVIYNLDHNISFKRNTEGFEYLFEGEKYNYYPDFIMEDNSYIEIKGYETEKDKAKYKDFPYTIKVLKYDDLKYIFDYVIQVYGKDFISLYDNLLYKPKSKIELSKINKTNNINLIKDKILNSNIDFSKRGWVGETAKIIGISDQKVTDWMRRNMYDFWLENCYKRKGTKKLVE